MELAMIKGDNFGIALLVFKNMKDKAERKSGVKKK